MDDFLKPIFVTSPYLPPLPEFIPYLADIWNSRILTNGGPFHEKLEFELQKYLEVDHVSLFSNATLALITALQSYRISGEVITTPYSFVASTHALHWNGIKPVFVDIEADTFTIDPEKIEAAITPLTTAILPVHVYGNPCKIEIIQRIADTYGLKVIYDAAHAFGVKKDGLPISNYGDLSVLSFHATKVFQTFEGGAIISHDKKMKTRIDQLKNFGFAGETTVIAPGINGKMNEIQAALGLLQLKHFESVIAKRHAVHDLYCQLLSNVQGVKIVNRNSNATLNYSYFPIIVDNLISGFTRDQLYHHLKENQIYTRRYFYPLISNFPTYRGHNSANISNLPVANQVSDSILCLPIYADLTDNDIIRIVSLIKSCNS